MALAPAPSVRCRPPPAVADRWGNRNGPGSGSELGRVPTPGVKAGCRAGPAASAGAGSSVAPGRGPIVDATPAGEAGWRWPPPSASAHAVGEGGVLAVALEEGGVGFDGVPRGSGWAKPEALQWNDPPVVPGWSNVQPALLC